MKQYSADLCERLLGAIDAEQDRTPPLPELTIELRRPERFANLSVHSPGGEMTGAMESDGLLHRNQHRDVPLYGIALLGPG